MAASVYDFASEQLIAQLLQEDLTLMDSYRQAEKLQLDQVIATSARAQGHIPKYSKDDTVSNNLDTDADIAFELYVSDARVSSDAAYAQTVQNEAFTANTVDMQMAQRMAANERKLNLDAEFARRLQDIDDEGQLDIDEVKDAESILGNRVVLLDPNTPKPVSGSVKENVKSYEAIEIEDSAILTTSKGKGRQLSSPPLYQDSRKRIKRESLESLDDFSRMKEGSTSPVGVPYSTCNICLEAFTVTNSPISATLSANSSTKLQFGLCLPCPKSHAYCISCLTSYIESKLDPDGRGVGKSIATVFPIRCPECPLVAWPEGIDDDVARRVLGDHGMTEWYHQRLLDSLPRFFCPNPKCSSLLEIDDNSEDPQAACPSCSQTICIPCRTRWHAGLTCEEYQALPLDERSPEDRAVLDLAKAQHWRRCPNCAVIVEHTFGCNHMTCRCGFHFCFKCGSPATIQGKCKSNPPCELWDEEMLLEARERERNRQAAAQQHIQHAPAPAHVDVAHAIGAYVVPEAPVPVAHHYHLIEHNNDLDWINDPDILCAKHWFTTDMIRNLTCGYCSLRLNSLADLRYHLSHVKRHPVYACCGRFFRRRVDYERHQQARAGRLGYHAYEMAHD